MTYCYSMTTDVIYEEHRSDWSHQVSAVVATRLQCDQTIPLCVVALMIWHCCYRTKTFGVCGPRIYQFENKLSPLVV